MAATGPDVVAREELDPRAESVQIERLLAEVEGLCGPQTWPRVEQLVHRLVTLYGSAIGQLHAHALAAGASAELLRARVREDELVASLLALHDDPSGDAPSSGALVPLKLPVAPRRDSATKCEMCGAAIDEAHPHVAEIRERRLACACHACSTLFKQPGAGADRFVTVPDRVRHDPQLVFGEDDWRALEVPVRLAFFLFSSATNGWIALYPGPAGTTESELPLERVTALGERTRLFELAQHDVEAVFAWTRRGERTAHCHLVPITACYELSARLRQSWKGLTGGDEASREIEAFLAATRERSRPLAPEGGER